MPLEDAFKLGDSGFVEITTLHPSEMQLLKMLRTRFRYGDVTIIMQDGVPLRVKRITEVEDLRT